ncbi:MAG: DUF3783 domain-containing protein [Acutalibacteraceae bacterium]
MKVNRSSGDVVCFNLPDEKYSSLEKICRKLGLRIRAVPKENFDQCIAAQFRIELPAGLGDPEEGKDYNFEEELLILHIQEESLFNRFLMESRSNDAVVNYKAVLTPTNAMWHPVQLKEQLAKEHEYMTQQAEQQKQQ